MKQVQRTSANWSGPSEYSVICSKHFTYSCFQPDSAIVVTLGLHKRQMEKPDVVPTLFERQALLVSSDNSASA